jgi:hypothetical protein
MYSRELAIWRYLNDPSLRRDPWNPSPPALSIIEREIHSSVDDGEAEAYIAMDRMYRLQDNPMMCTSDWVDFVRQMLQVIVLQPCRHLVLALTLTSLGPGISP